MKCCFDKYIILLIFILSGLGLKAQKEFVFTKGLVAAECHNYSRKSVNTDYLAYQLYSGNLEKPVKGKILFSDSKGHNCIWDSITAHKDGVFKSQAFYQGYLYLTYFSDAEQAVMINITGNSMVFFNGVPHSGDIYGDGWMNIPVKLKKGLNEIYIRTSMFSVYGLTAKLIFPEKQVFMNSADMTLPDIVAGKDNQELWGALVITNLTDKPLHNLVIETGFESKKTSTSVKIIPPMSIRKIGFKINAGNITKEGTYTFIAELKQENKIADKLSFDIMAVLPSDKYRNTFISAIDGSIQYYAVSPPSDENLQNPALFLSLHGAGVEAIGQARAYEQKDWGVLIAPTNRRPRGFNWEDWGSIDALEVLDLATKEFSPDPERIYLTGHSMGGHGTWYVGATFPDKWAAIAPCAGYPSLIAYGSADGKIPSTGTNETENTFLRASNSSNIYPLINNYKPLGIYIHHGDSDMVVPVGFARQMRKQLGEFHPDFSYYEYPGGSHWFSNQSVDWPPIFEYFKWHKRKTDSLVNRIDFTTANPAVSSSYYWATIYQQKECLEYSKINLERNLSDKTITGTTQNVSVLKLNMHSFARGDVIVININNSTIQTLVKQPDDPVYIRITDQVVLTGIPSSEEKSYLRNGTFKEPFNHNMVFVYGTKGNSEENNWMLAKALFDAETWYYRGNGSVDVVADIDFRLSDYTGRNIILYGNATTNSLYKTLLSDCPVKVNNGAIKAGSSTYKGENLGALFVWPLKGSDRNSVAVICGSGLRGMKAAFANQYFAAGSGYPDYIIFSLDMLKDGEKAIKETGFYSNNWKIVK